MTKSFKQIGTAAGKLVEEKSRAYGSSFATSGEALRLLFPRGVSPKQLTDALLLARIWDKMMRIATDRDALGENPYGDIIGYGILGVHMHQHSKEGNTAPCGSASDAEQTSKAQQSDSAAQDVPAPTTTSDEGLKQSALLPLSHRESPSTSASTSASALTATERASRLAAVLENAQEDNDQNKCAGCGWVRLLAQRRIFNDQRVFFCGMACVTDFVRRAEALR